MGQWYDTKLLTLLDNPCFELSPEDEKKLRIACRDKTAFPLSPADEIVPFWLFFLGNSIDSVCQSTRLKKEIILFTALKYNWPGKIKNMQAAPMVTQTLLSLLGATVEQVKISLEELRERKTVSKTSVLAKSTKDVETLIKLLIACGALPGMKSLDQRPGDTVINADNVQINQGATLAALPPTPDEIIAFENDRKNFMEIEAAKVLAKQHKNDKR